MSQTPDAQPTTNPAKGSPTAELELPNLVPDPSRVIQKLTNQLGDALGQLAMYEDLVQQLQAERVAAASAAQTAAAKPAKS